MKRTDGGSGRTRCRWRGRAGRRRRRQKKGRRCGRLHVSVSLALVLVASHRHSPPHLVWSFGTAMAGHRCHLPASPGVKMDEAILPPKSTIQLQHKRRDNDSYRMSLLRKNEEKVQRSNKTSLESYRQRRGSQIDALAGLSECPSDLGRLMPQSASMIGWMRPLFHTRAMAQPLLSHKGHRRPLHACLSAIMAALSCRCNILYSTWLYLCCIQLPPRIVVRHGRWNNCLLT